MKIGLITQAITNRMSTVQNYNDRQYAINSLKNDVFVKNTNEISFTGRDDNQIENKDNLKDALLGTGIVGGAFLLSLTAGVAMAKGQNPEQIFLPDGSFLCNASDLSVKSDKVFADGDEGIYKVQGTGINLDPKRFDYVDVEHGIYRNYDGSADISLLENKYIDSKNGIFVDQEKEMSLVYNGDHFEYIGLPSFTSGHATNELDGCRDYLPIEESDSKNFIEKTFDIIKHSLFDSKEAPKDLFGRDLVANIDNHGHQFLSAIPNTQSFNEFLHQGKSVEEATQFSNENLLKSYVQDYNTSQVTNLDATQNEPLGFSTDGNEHSFYQVENHDQGAGEDSGTNFDPDIDLNNSPIDFGS